MLIQRTFYFNSTPYLLIRNCFCSLVIELYLILVSLMMDWISQNQFAGCSNTLLSISSTLILVIITTDNKIPTLKNLLIC